MRGRKEEAGKPDQTSGMAPRLCSIIGLLLLGALPPAAATGSGAEPEDAGEAIYLRGVLGSGSPLEAHRDGGARMQGADAACVNCHRRSGFGVREGNIAIPPVAGRYLMRRNGRPNRELNLPYVETMHADHDPSYTDATLARAIREGLDAEGKPLSYLMPQYDLSDSQASALIGYLKSLDQRELPGVTDTVLHFATIITPDADPAKRRGMLDVIEHYVADHNAAQLMPSPQLRTSRKTLWANTLLMVHRRWEMHVWELKGTPDTWEGQLRQDFAREPVLAVVSGLGGRNWEPVHAFCEHQGVPCLFPNVEAPPVDADRDFYSLYFSKGVLLEAELIANRVAETGTAKAVHQIYRSGDNGEMAAKALASALERRGIEVRTHVIAQGATSQGVSRVVRQAAGADMLVLWLRPPDLSALGSAPKGAQKVFMSGLMGGLESAPLPASWSSRVEIAYPFDLPEKRRVPVDFALAWFSIRHIPVVDEQVQANTFLACGLLAEALSDMAGNFVPDYLVERVQDMLAHRIMTGYFPHLSLAPGQRFASKGGYLVHFAKPGERRVIADSNWVVP